MTTYCRNIKTLFRIVQPFSKNALTSKILTNRQFKENWLSFKIIIWDHCTFFIIIIREYKMLKICKALSTIQKANSTVKPKKSFSKYKYGEMVIEWKRDKDAMGNIFGAGHKQVYVV
ncbi:unnamed protein product [Rhizophagus irregularis]|nr:unnamed protein product [Rhizophagus irregularis]